MLMPEEFVSESSTSDEIDKAAGERHERFTVIWSGFGSCARSASHASRTRPSHASSAYTKRRSMKAGPSQTNPTKSGIKKRSPNATPKRLKDFVGASISGGTSRPRSLTSEPRPRAAHLPAPDRE